MSEMTLSDLDGYLSKAKEVLAKFEEKLGWKPPDLKQRLDLVVCPYDDAHRILQKNFDDHVRRCKWRKLNYTFEEIEEIFEQEDITKTQSDSTLICRDDIVEQVAPGVGILRTDERYKSSLSAEQRLAVYEAEARKLFNSEDKMPDKALYVDLAAKAAEKLYEKENPENLSEVELKQKIRDMKRRRQSYRAKNVHITKRSQTEIIRGVLEVHMEELRKLWSPEQEFERPQQQEEGKQQQQDDDKSRDSSRHSRERRGHYNNYDRKDLYRLGDHRRSRDGRRDRERSSSRDRKRRSRYSPSRKRARRSRSRDRTSRHKRDRDGIASSTDASHGHRNASRSTVSGQRVGDANDNIQPSRHSSENPTHLESSGNRDLTSVHSGKLGVSSITDTAHEHRRESHTSASNHPSGEVSSTNEAIAQDGRGGVSHASSRQGASGTHVQGVKDVGDYAEDKSGKVERRVGQGLHEFDSTIKEKKGLKKKKKAKEKSKKEKKSKKRRSRSRS